MTTHPIPASNTRAEPPINDANPKPGEYLYQIRIPKERIAVLIGKNGKIKSSIEQELHTSITIDSSEGEVSIKGDDALSLLTGREIIKAIGRGFNPSIALSLSKQDTLLEIINLGTLARSHKDLERLKGRIIGAGGKCRRVVEDLTETSICVYGKTVSIIGSMETHHIARKAIEMLIAGSSHPNVYKWLERQRKNLRMRA